MLRKTRVYTVVLAMPCFAMQTTQLMFAQMPLRVITNEKEENIQLKKEIDCKVLKAKRR